jgi:hypothetical protein
MHSLVTVLSLPHEAMYLALGDHLAARVDAGGVNSLTSVERTLWFSREFEWAIRDGGLLGYMFSETGRSAREAEAALRVIGAMHTADVLRDAIPARDCFADEFYEACGKLWEELEDLPALICQYARANREALLGSNATH